MMRSRQNMANRPQIIAVAVVGAILLFYMMASDRSHEVVVAKPTTAASAHPDIASLKHALDSQAKKDAAREEKNNALLNEVNALRKELQKKPNPPPEKAEAPMAVAPSMEKTKKVQVKNLFSRPLGADSVPHTLKEVPTYVDYMEVYTHVTELAGIQNVFFAYRDTPCIDWNKQRPKDLFIDNVMGAIRASIPRGGTVIDIGACYGDTAIPMAATIADRVIAFEPNPKSFAVLDFNAKMNPGLRIEPHNYAAAGDAKTTSLEFTYSGGGDMCNGGVFDPNMEHSKTEKHFRLPATHIPTFLEKTYGEEIYDEITFIKIDAEGFDPYILKTLKPIFKRNPKIICMVEWFDMFKVENPEDIHPKSQELFDVIEEMGFDAYEPYSMSRVTPQGKYKVPDLTLLPKGTKPWKANAFDQDTFSIKARPNRAKAAKLKKPADIPEKLEAPSPAKPAVVKNIWTRNPNTHEAHQPLMVPAFVDYIDAYVNVSTNTDKSTVLFAYRDTPCIDWNKQRPKDLFVDNVMGAIRASIPRGGTIIDIGACYGDTGVPMAATIGDRVIAFEPNPKSFAVLDFNAKLNPGLKLEPHNFAAAGDASTTSLEFTYSGGGDMCNGGVFDPNMEHSKTEKHWRLPATHIPTYLEKTYGAEIYDEITFIKIDAEGFDPYILRTLKPIFKANPKIIVMIEWFDMFKVENPEDIHPKSQELFDVIEEMGFDPYEPYFMKPVTPQGKYKVPDLTLLPKGTKPWKPFR